MKIITTIFFAAALMLSITFIGGAISSWGTNGVTAQDTMERKTGHASRKVYRNGKLVAVRTYSGGRWVTHKVKRGSKWTWHTVKHGTTRRYHRVKKAM